MPVNLKILVVDDNRELREVLAEQFTYEGFEVVTACNGSEALGILLKSPHIRFLVTDCEMPKLSGVDLIEAIHQKGIPLDGIIMISGQRTLIRDQVEISLPDIKSSIPFTFLDKPITAGTIALIIEMMQKQAVA